MVAELFTDHITGGNQGIKAHVAFVGSVFKGVADTSADLFGNKSTAVYGTCRYTDYAVKMYVVLGQNIQNSGSIYGAMGASFKH